MVQAIKSTNLQPHESVNFKKTTKIEPHENKVFHSILCIQEHWLFTFEKEEIADFTNTDSVYSKACDQYDNITPQERTRGHGGVAILWHNRLDRYVKTLEDGNNRIVCLQLQDEQLNLLIMNVYMPCRNTHTGDNFSETLDQLQELLAKYRPTHHIIICGDINASLHRTPPNGQDQLLKAFCAEKNVICKEEIHPEHSSTITTVYIRLKLTIYFLEKNLKI